MREASTSRRWVMGAVAVAAVAVVAVSNTVAPGAYATLVVSNVAWVLASALAAVTCGRAARQAVAPWRVGWGLLAATAGLWALANVGSAVYDLVFRQPVPVPSLLDVPYLGAQVCALAAAILLLRPFVGRGGLARTLVDVGLVTMSLAYLSAATFFADPSGGVSGLTAVVVAWAYPVSDVLLVAVAIVAVSRLPREFMRIAAPLVGGFVAIGIANSLWAFDVLSGENFGDALASVLYVVGYLGLALAPSSRRPAAVPTITAPVPAWMRLLPSMAVVVALVALVVQHLAEPYPEIIGVGVVLLLFARQVLVHVENLRLSANLELKVDERTADLAASEALLRSVTDVVSDAVLVLDAGGQARYESTNLRQAFGTVSESDLGEMLFESVHPDDIDAVTRFAAEVAAGSGETRTIQARIRTADSWNHYEITLANRLDHPHIRGMVMASRDVSEQHALTEQLRHRAEHDDLTGLANRAVLIDHLRDKIHNGDPATVLLLDLDEFKGVNDRLGHAVGDRLLVSVGKRLTACLGDGDLLARLGGDEFAVVVDGDRDAGISLAVRIDQALQLPFTVDLWLLRCRASIGVADADAGGDAEDVLRDADLAMYEAKAKGKGRIETFHVGMHRRIVQRMALEDSLRAAVEREELHVVFQPIIDLHTGEVLGAEALCRWHLADHDVEPSEFIPVAEDTGLIGPLGRFVLDRACAVAAGWQILRPDGRPPTVAVNVSVRQLVEHDLVGDVTRALVASGLPPECLTIELTESALMEHSEQVLARLHALKALGVHLSIDDFGTGYSSLGRLRFLPVDEVKIDRSFVASLDDLDQMPVVEAVLALADSLGLEVVAEGVEDELQAEALRRRGCRKAQGYLFGRPMSGRELGVLLKTGVEVATSDPT